MRKKLEDLSREEMLALLTAIRAEFRSPRAQDDPSAFVLWLETVFQLAPPPHSTSPADDWEVELP